MTGLLLYYIEELKGVVNNFNYSCSSSSLAFMESGVTKRMRLKRRLVPPSEQDQGINDHE